MFAPPSDPEYIKKRAEEYRREERALAEVEKEFNREERAQTAEQRASEREAERKIKYFTDKYESSDDSDRPPSLPIASD